MHRGNLNRMSISQHTQARCQEKVAIEVVKIEHSYQSSSSASNFVVLTT